MFDLSRQSTSLIKRASRKSVARPAPLTVTAYGEFDGIGMGRLSNGDAFVTQRGLAALCGVQNAHIGTISRDWHEDRPRIQTIRARLARYGDFREIPHRVLTFQGHRLYCYDLAVCQAVLDYYAVDAGAKTQDEAQANRIRFRGNGLKTFINDNIKRPGAAGPLRFMPVRNAALQTAEDAWTAGVAHIWGLYVMSFWLAAAYVNTLREKAEKAEWNRLGLYVPLKAILEIQAEVMASWAAGMDTRVPYGDFGKAAASTSACE